MTKNLAVYIGLKQTVKRYEAYSSKINNDEYNALVKEAEKLRKHRESVNKSVKKYNANHKADPAFLEYNRIKAKKFYERHKEELKEKRQVNKWKSDSEVYSIMQILAN